MRGLCYFLLLILTQVSCSTFKVIGLLRHNVTLPCRHDTQTHSTLSFCWGRGKVPMSKCADTVLSSDNGAVLSRRSPRYQLLGRVTDGDVSLTILNAQLSDAGVYGCRVEIPGWFNDYKVNTRLVMEEELLTTSAPTNVEVGDARFDTTGSVKAEEEFKAFVGVVNIGRMAAISFFAIIIILVFIFRRGFLPKLQHLNTSPAENIYESIPIH